MDKLELRSYDGCFNALYLNGKKFFGWRPDCDPLCLIQKLGMIGKYDVTVGTPLTEAEYERDWC
jgi:hypothetical protein